MVSFPKHKQIIPYDYLLSNSSGIMFTEHTEKSNSSHMNSHSLDKLVE